MIDTNADRLEQLEQRIEELEVQLHSQAASQAGVSRRSVLGGLGAVGTSGLLGAYFGSQRAQAQEGSGTIGTEENPLDTVYADTLDVNDIVQGSGSESLDIMSLTVEEILGDIVNRTEPIDHLEGNVYLTEEDASDPTQNDGDLWFEYASE